MQHERVLALVASCISQGKKPGAGKKCARWRRSRIRRWHSDGAVSEKVQADNHADRDGGIAQAHSTFQPADKCPVQPYGDSKNPLIEVDSIDGAGGVAGEPSLMRFHRKKREAEQPQVFDISTDDESEDLFPVASTEKESDADKNRRDSWVTKVPEEGDDLEEFDESDECQCFDDGVGGVAQVATPQMFDITCDISSDLDGESEEPVLPEMPFAPPEGDYGEDSEMTENLEQFRHEQGRDTLVSTSGSSGSSYQVRKPCVWIRGIPFEAEDFDTGWEYLYDGLVCPEAETITKVQEARHDARLAEDTLCPQIFLHLLCFLPVTEVLEYNLQAVSRNFSSREVWMTHLFNLMDFDSFQPVTGIPTAPVWHPIEEFSACVRITAYCTDESLSMRKRLWSPPVVQFRAEASEGFQGCWQALCGPWAEKLQDFGS